MITLILAGALAVAAPQQQQTDTTFDVRAGGQLDLESLNGTVVVTTWDRSAMRVRATHRGRSHVDIDRSGADVSIEVEPRGGAPDAVAFEITVPRSYHVALEGVNLRASVDGTQGRVTIENVEGAIVVRNVTGDVDVESVSGSITVSDVRGDVSVTSVIEAVSLSSIRGDIEAETVNGSIVMRSIDASNVEANTVNGLVEYHGSVRDGGHYYLGTHNGRITMGVPEQANARITIATQNGRVEAGFPVQIRNTGDREFSFTVGNGSAHVELESYNGTVFLVRPGTR